MSEGRRIVGWSPEPCISHADVVDLLYGLTTHHDDFQPDRPDSWKYGERYLTGSEQFIVRCASADAWADARALMDLDTDERREHLEWQQRVQRLADQLDELDGDEA
jgi:hypothetical protein